MKARYFGLAVALLFLAASVCGQRVAADAQARASDPVRTYKTVLYPRGMPMCSDPDEPNLPDAKKVKATFRFYDETALPFAGQTAVLYSKDCELKPGADNDFGHALYLAIVQATGQQLRVIRIHDLTEKIPIELEEPGQVAVLDALLETYAVSKGISGLHVHIWARLSGSGNLSQATDLFYRPEKDGALNPILELKETSSFGRSGACDWNASASHIWLTDKDGDSSDEIYVETEMRELKECKPRSRSQVAVYKFSGGKYERVATHAGKSPGGLAPSHVLKSSSLIIFPEFDPRP